jgi:hypothetical protein
VRSAGSFPYGFGFSSLTYHSVFCIFNPTISEFDSVIFKGLAMKINVEFLGLPMVSDVIGKKRLKVDFQGETVKDVIDDLIRSTEALSAQIIHR